MKRLLTIAFALLLGAWTRGNNGSIPASYFGMGFNAPVAITWPAFNVGMARIWDTTANAAGVEWTDVETSNGVYVWTNLDAVISTYQSHGSKIIYTIAYGYDTNWQTSGGGVGPPTDINGSGSAIFSAFLTQLVTRYKGKITAYECWNEADSNTFWTGTIAQMVAMCSNVYSVVHSIDPAAVVLSPSTGSGPSGTNWQNTFIADGGASYFDVLSIHCYPWNASVGPEFIVNEITYNKYNLMAANLSKPLWCDEFSDPVPTVPLYVAIEYILGQPSGASNLSWYQFDNTNFGYLEGSVSQGLNSGGVAYLTVENWLGGAKWTTPPARQPNSNQIRNTTWTGAIVGSPGTAPTNMSFGGTPSSGVTGSVSGVSTGGFCWAVSGTPNQNGNINLNLETTSQITGYQYEVFNLSFGMSLQSGSATSAGLSIYMQFNEYHLGGSTYVTTDVPAPQLIPITGLSAAQQLYWGSTALTGAATTSVQPQIILNFTNGDPVNLTLCFGGTPTMDDGTEWVGDLTLNSGAKSVVAWDAANGGWGTINFTTTSACGGANCTTYMDVAGAVHAVSGSSVALTSSPILLSP